MSTCGISVPFNDRQLAVMVGIRVLRSLRIRDWKKGSFSGGMLPVHKSSFSRKESSKIEASESVLAEEARLGEVSEGLGSMAVRIAFTATKSKR